jgi:OTU-like cysteine protease
MQAQAGVCQFSSVSDQLFESSPVTESFRPDLWLRECALHTITSAPHAYQDFMLSAAPMTRQQHQLGGAAICIDDYATRMSHVGCDGDHITLQALSDCLQVCINVIKWESTACSIAKLRPRGGVLLYLDSRVNAIQLRKRTLWLSLHGELHYRSIHPRNDATVQEVCDQKITSPFCVIFLSLAALLTKHSLHFNLHL